MIMTGQAQTRPAMTQAQFKNRSCSKVTCAVRLRQRHLRSTSQSYSAFGSVNIADPIDASGNFVPPNKYLPRRSRRYRRGADILSMADVRHQARLQHLQSDRQQAAADRDRRVPERTLLGGPMTPLMKPMTWISGFACGARRAIVRSDRRGIAAIEFAIIVPVMLVMFFGTVEFSSGIAVEPQGDADGANAVRSDVARASGGHDDPTAEHLHRQHIGIMTPYSPTPVKATITEIYIDPTEGARFNGASRRSSRAAPRGNADGVEPQRGRYRDKRSDGALVKQTYLIFSEVNYTTSRRSAT